jgi:hypothetical protein
MIEKDQNKATKIQLMAQNLLDSARMEAPLEELLDGLRKLDLDELEAALPDEHHRKAFWINLYNAFNLLTMKGDPDASQKRKGRMKHFMKKEIEVAGKRLSLMNIENDLLRRGKLWWSLGYLSRPFPGTFFRRFRTKELDPRIHFALNCGAMSCPPIRFYVPDEIESQLELATAGFVATEVQRKLTESDPTAIGSTLHVSSIFRLYQGDFGGKQGIVKLIRKYRDDVPEGQIRLRWLSYDWTINLDAFVR